jgi:hypothetical protein
MDGTSPVGQLIYRKLAGPFDGMLKVYLARSIEQLM